MSLRHLILLRSFSTSRILATPALSADYKSPQLWDARFKCSMLEDTPRIKSINTKILSCADLDNLEVDIFVNIAGTRENDISPLQEAARILNRFRKSLYANMLLPSTHHATCRLFLESHRMSSLMMMLEERIDFGIFPDAFTLNLIFDQALGQGELSLASRAAALMMLQEEFGLNKISDTFALYSTSKYIESKTDFSDWQIRSIDQDPVFNEAATDDTENSAAQMKAAKVEEKSSEEEADAEGEEEDDEDAEYHRVPFLKNPYFDNHFDLKNPRVICGKTISMIGVQLAQEESKQIANRCQILGNILQGRWLEAKSVLDESLQSKLSVDVSFKELNQHYITELHGVDAPADEIKSSLMSSLEKLNQDTSVLKLSEQAESVFNNLKEYEKNDINWMKRVLHEWSDARKKTLQAMQEIENRKKIIDEIKAKKDELNKREQFLFFYDKLIKKSLTKIEYK